MAKDRRRGRTAEALERRASIGKDRGSSIKGGLLILYVMMIGMRGQISDFPVYNSAVNRLNGGAICGRLIGRTKFCAWEVGFEDRGEEDCFINHFLL